MFHYYSKLKLYTPLFTSAGVAIAFLLTLYTLYLFVKNEDAALQNALILEIHTHDVLFEAEHALSALIDVETGERGYLITTRRDFLETYEAARLEAAASLDKLKSLTNDNASQQAHIADLHEVVVLQFAVLAESIVNAGAANPPTLVAMVESKRLLDQARRILASIVLEERRLLLLRHDASQAASKAGQAFISYLGLASSLIFLGSLFAMLLSWRSRAAVRFSERKIGLMFDSVQGHAIFMMDAEGLISSWNFGAEKLQGYANDDIIGRHFSLFYTAEDVANRKPEGELIIAAREGRVEDEGWRVRKDGSRFMASVIINAIRDARGDLRGFVQVTRDITDRKKIENELNETRERFALAADTAGVGFWIYDVEMQSFEWDSEMYRLYELAPGATLDIAAWRSRIHPADQERAEAEFREAIGGGRPFDTEFRIVQPSGEARCLRANATVKRDAATGGLRIYGVNFDITERKETESELTETNERFALAADAAGLGYWNYDLSTETLGWDDQMFRLYGVDREHGEQPYALWRSHLHPDDRARAEDEFREAITGGRSFDTEFRIVLSGGEVRHLRASAAVRPDPTTGGARMFGINFDITERKRTERELVETSSRFRNVLTAASEVAIIATDPKLLITVFNTGAEKLLGYASEEMIGREAVTLFHDGDEVRLRGQELSRELAYPVEGGDVFTEPSTLQCPRGWTYVRKDGRRVRVSLVVTAVRNEAGALLGYLCMAHDVTREKEIEGKLRHATALAEQASRTKSEFLANMTHELRTPLTGILGLHDLLARDATLLPEQKSQIALARDAGRSLLNIVNDILDFSKIEAGQLAIENAPFKPAEVIEACRRLGQEGGRRKSLDVSVDLIDIPAVLVGDAARLRQIILNLVTNAVKFTERGGVLIQANYDHGAERLRVEVIDSGIGIAEDKLPMLFQRFSQTDTSTTRRYGGTGLGLAISRRLVGLMDGKIGVKSEPGRGSTFWFELPLSAALHAVEHTPVWQAVRIGGLRLLLAEDNHVNQEIIKTMLEQFGHSVTVVGNGLEALEMLRQSPDFNVVLMDIQMPVMDGLTATASIRENEKIEFRAAVPIIGLTANAMSDDVQRCLAIGMNAHVAKPIEWQVLFDAIEHVTMKVAPAAARQAAAPDCPRQVADEATLAQVASLLGLQPFAELLGMFTGELEALAAQLDTIGDAALASRAHKFKSSAGQMGFEELFELCATIERDVREGSGRPTIEEFRSGLGRAIAAARSFAACERFPPSPNVSGGLGASGPKSFSPDRVQENLLEVA